MAKAKAKGSNGNDSCPAAGATIEHRGDPLPDHECGRCNHLVEECSACQWRGMNHLEAPCTTCGGLVIGRRCRMWPRKGATVCSQAGGSSPHVLAAAQRRLAMADAAKTLDAQGITPVGNPLDALADVVAEQIALKDWLADHVAEMKLALTGKDDKGKEHARALLVLYTEALAACEKFLVDWVRLGFDERMTALHESEAKFYAALFTTVFTDPTLALSPAQVRTARQLVRVKVEELAA